MKASSQQSTGGLGGQALSPQPSLFREILYQLMEVDFFLAAVIKVLYRGNTVSEFILAHDNSRAGVDLVGAFEAAFHVAAIGHFGADAGVAERLQDG